MDILELVDQLDNALMWGAWLFAISGFLVLLAIAVLSAAVSAQHYGRSFIEESGFGIAVSAFLLAVGIFFLGFNYSDDSKSLRLELQESLREGISEHYEIENVLFVDELEISSLMSGNISQGQSMIVIDANGEQIPVRVVYDTVLERPVLTGEGVQAVSVGDPVSLSFGGEVSSELQRKYYIFGVGFPSSGFLSTMTESEVLKRVDSGLVTEVQALMEDSQVVDFVLVRDSSSGELTLVGDEEGFDVSSLLRNPDEGV